MKKNIITGLVCSVLFLLIGYTIGFFNGEKVYEWVVKPFHNTQGRFDLSIVWSAFAGVATVFLGWVAWRQNQNANKTNQRLSIEQLISSCKTKIKAVGIVMPFTDFNVLINDGKGYCTCLFTKNLKIENNYYYSGVNFKITLRADEFNYITSAKITTITVYYNYVKIEEVGTDENPGYFYSDSEEGGYCSEISFANAKGYYSLNCMENGIGEIDSYCLLDKTKSTDDIKKNIEVEHPTPNTDKLKKALIDSEKIVIEIHGEFINGFKVVTKGAFQFKLKRFDNTFEVTNKIFIPGGYNYKEDAPNE